VAKFRVNEIRRRKIRRQVPDGTGGYRWEDAVDTTVELGPAVLPGDPPRAMARARVRSAAGTIYDGLVLVLAGNVDADRFKLGDEVDVELVDG
jgi:hypothetical protein